MAKCEICGKGPRAGRNVPNSQHKTARTFKPNIQRVNGVDMCTRCLRTIKSIAKEG
jgi:large subunit ribosomal protein L28